MAQKRDYATKKKGKTEKYPFWNLEDIKNVVEWLEKNEKWDAYLITLLELLLGRRIGDTISLRWSDLYYENGNQREELTTVEEQKTGKTAEVPINSLVFEVVDKYCKHVNVNPMEHYDEFIFNFKSKSEWIAREGNPIYKENDLEKWCLYLGKDISEDRKKVILEGYEKFKRKMSFGDYLYYEVEWTDILKWHGNAYRNTFNDAVKASKVPYKVSTHSLRKSFGYWIHQLHPYDPDCIISLSKLFQHDTVQQTTDYIGLTKEKNKKYVDNYANLIRNVLDGKGDEVIKNSPVISLKTEDFGKIIMEIIKTSDMSDVEKYQMAINLANELRVS